MVFTLWHHETYLGIASDILKAWYMLLLLLDSLILNTSKFKQLFIFIKESADIVGFNRVALVWRFFIRDILFTTHDRRRTVYISAGRLVACSLSHNT